MMSDFATRRVFMVDTQVRPSDVTKFPIIAAMLSVPREVYVPPALVEAAYVGENIALGPHRVLLEPRTFAKMVDMLDITPADVVLDLGAGLGYTAAVLAQIADAVIAVEEDAGLATDAQANLLAQNVDNAAVVTAPLVAGASRHGPYDVILISGGVEVVPDALVDQMKDGGRIAAIFMSGALGQVRIGIKADGRIGWRMGFNATAPVLPGFARVREFSL